MKKLIAALIVVAIVIFYFPLLAFAENETSNLVEVYVNGELERTYEPEDRFYEYGEAIDLYDEIYGNPVRVEGTGNGRPLWIFDWQNPEFNLDLYEDFSPSEPPYIVKAYYETEEEIEEPEIEYGTVELRIANQYGEPTQNYEVTFNGSKKGYEDVLETAFSDDLGILTISLDLSYEWMYSCSESNYLVVFSPENEYSSDHVVPVEDRDIPTPPPVIDHEDYILSLSYWFHDDPGGTLTDGVPDNYTVSQDTEIVATSGETYNIYDYCDGLTTEDYFDFEYSGDPYRVGTIYVEGAVVSDGQVIMPSKNIRVSIVFMFVRPAFTVSVHYLDAATGAELLDSVSDTFTTPSSVPARDPIPYNMLTYLETPIEGYTYNHASAEGEGYLTDNLDIYVYYDREVTPPPYRPSITPSTPEPETSVDIIDDEIPLAELPEIEITDEETPLSDLTIPDEEVPLEMLPETGDSSLIWAVIFALSGSALLFLGLRKQEE